MKPAIPKKLWGLLIATVAGLGGCHEEDHLEQLRDHTIRP
jgi:hypothetical protein